MLNSFVAAAQNQANQTVTENDAPAFKSTLDTNLDFFAKSGNINFNALEVFKQAFNEDRNLAIRNLLHTRDVRNGKGIRNNSRKILSYLADSYPELIIESKIIKAFIEVGRWDDIFEVLKGSNKRPSNYVLSLIVEELSKPEPNGLLCKWLPRKMVKAEDRKSNYDIIPLLIQKRMGLTPKQYRKLLVQHTKVVETDMCANNWDAIKYEHVPSKAHNIYKFAFKRHSPEKYTEYLNKVETGETKINATTLWPHEVIGPFGNLVSNKTAQTLWNSLPNFMPEDITILPVIDVSTSMCQPIQGYPKYLAIDVAIAMGLYMATKNKSVFKDLFLTFHSNPKLVALPKNATLERMYNTVRHASWGGSTNLIASVKLILDLAVKNKVPQKDMPKAIVVLSDMQFNRYNSNMTSVEEIEQLYRETGYKTPEFVWWNICGGNTTRADELPVPVTKDQSGCSLVSGYSPSIIKSIFNVNFENFTPYNVMIETLEHSRYDWI